jgi:hypothetical protein
MILRQTIQLLFALMLVISLGCSDDPNSNMNQPDQDEIDVNTDEEEENEDEDEDDEEEEEEEEALATLNAIRIESGTFDADKPTIIFFGGGNCENSWEGTESWNNEETNGSAWFEEVNIISYHSYIKDSLSSEEIYFDAAGLVVDSLLALSPEYNKAMQVCGFSTGGTPALDLALYINNQGRELPFRVSNITLFDTPCNEYTERFDQIMSVEQPPLIVHLLGLLYYENGMGQPYAGVLNALINEDSHDDVFWWYVNSLTNDNANAFNDGLTAGSFLSVIGEGKDIRIPYDNSLVEYYFKWVGNPTTGSLTFYDENKYPKRISLAD